jgi:uncharacterized protein (TIGR02421 family)
VREKKNSLFVEKTLRAIDKQLRAQKPVRRRIPGVGNLHFDRPFPFLCIYRPQPEGEDRGTAQLLKSEAAYFLLESEPVRSEDFPALLQGLIQSQVERFGAFLLVEVWSSDGREGLPVSDKEGVLQPGFRIYRRKSSKIEETVDAFISELKKIKIQRQEPGVEIEPLTSLNRTVRKPLLSHKQEKQLGCRTLSLEISPVYRSVDGRSLYPLVLRRFRRGFSRALKRGLHRFSSTLSGPAPPSYLALGRRSMVKVVGEVDRRLVDISEPFDLLLLVTPVNVESAWRRFRRRKFEEAPHFQYRPLPIDPSLEKRKLFSVPIERIDDPTMELLFREKQAELDRQLTLLGDRGTNRFLLGSRQLYGSLDEKLLAAARTILDRLPAQKRESSGRSRSFSAEAFADRAREEFRWYRSQYPGFSATVSVRPDIYSGLMVSRGQLLVGRETSIPARRVEALLHHEVGTHLVTYYNGRAQPLHILSLGLAGYDELQEGLAVLGELLCGGLNPARLRLLAARVMAAKMLIDGADFVQTFRCLTQDYGFTKRTAYTITMRTYRGGGLTKDAIYLRGFLQVLDYLQKGGELEPLFVGKMAFRHLPLVRELQWRQVLKPLPLRPRFMEQSLSQKQLVQLRAGIPLEQLIKQILSRRKKHR